MILNLYGNDGLIFNTLATGFTEAHLKESFKFDVVNVDNVGSKFKEAVKKEYSAKFLDDADMVIRFVIPHAVNPEETPEEEETEEETPEKTQTPEETPEKEETEEETSEDEETKEETPEEEETKEDDDKKKQTLKESTSKDNDISQKIIKTLKRCLYIKDTETIELSDLNNFIEGQRVAFVKISLTDKSQTPTK